MEDTIKTNKDVRVGGIPEEADRLIITSDESISELLLGNIPSDLHPSEKVRHDIWSRVCEGQLNQETDVLLARLISGLSQYTSLPIESIRFFAGRNQAFDSIAKAYFRAGDKVLICGPSGEEFVAIAERYGTKTLYHHSQSPFSADPEGILERFSSRTRLIYLQNPNRITGTVYTTSEVEWILDHLPNAVLALDETCYEYFGASQAGLVRQYNNLVVLRTFSAALGLREPACSYVLTSPDNQIIINWPDFDQKFSKLALVAAIAVLDNLEYVDKHIEMIRENMTYLSVRLRGLGVSCRMTPADVLLIKVVDPELVISSLEQEKVNAHNISHIPQLENYISLLVGDDATTARAVEVFKKMPREYYETKTPGRARIVLRRAPETIEGNNDKESPQKRA